MAFALLLASCRMTDATVSRARWNGWETHVIRNRSAEVVVVPAIGRVMQFRMLEEQAPGGIFWSHPALGPALAPDENGWINFGGDKAWPAPQSAWQVIAGRGWPPPRTFDAVAHAATIEGGAVVLVSPIDPAYGMRVRRKISLHATDAVMSIETTYEKVSGAPVRVGVWTITQLVSPERVFVLLPERSAFAAGHRRVLPPVPKDFAVEGRLLSLARDTADKTMIASDGEALLWVGAGPALLIEAVTPAPAGAGAAWPEGAHSQIYTSPDGAESYVELELLGPLHDLAPGQSAAMSVRYRLLRRQEADATAEARRVFAAELGPNALKARQAGATDGNRFGLRGRSRLFSPRGRRASCPCASAARPARPCAS